MQNKEFNFICNFDEKLLHIITFILYTFYITIINNFFYFLKITNFVKYVLYINLMAIQISYIHRNYYFIIEK